MTTYITTLTTIFFALHVQKLSNYNKNNITKYQTMRRAQTIEH